MSEGGRWQAPVAVPGEETSAISARILSGVLVLELLWLLLIAASVVFLAAQLSGDTSEFPADPAARRILLVAMPPLAIVMGLALIGARQAIDHRVSSPSTTLNAMRRTALWLTAVANAALALSILTSLYHAHATWIVVGLLLAASLSVVAVACVRATRS